MKRYIPAQILSIEVLSTDDLLSQSSGTVTVPGDNFEGGDPNEGELDQ